MLEIKNVDVYGLEKSLKRSGYPMQVGDLENFPEVIDPQTINDDIKRGKKLGKVKTGTGHDNFLKGIIVQFDVKYPQYWTPQFQRYSFADIISSQSKMHKLTSVKNLAEQCNHHVLPSIVDTVENLIKLYNMVSNMKDLEIDVTYNDTDTLSKRYTSKKQIFNAIVSNLPMGYEMWMGISTNYLQLKTIYQQRSNHKLDEWIAFCDWCDKLPRFRELIGLDQDNSNG